MSNVEKIFPSELNYVRDKITRPAALEQAAEECAELSQACLKVARILRKENPTPVDINEAYNNLSEEYNDVFIAMKVVGIDEDYIQMKNKLTRWAKRLSEVDNG